MNREQLTVKHPATDKIGTITTGQLPLATYKLGITGKALLKQLKQQTAKSIA